MGKKCRLSGEYAEDVGRDGEGREEEACAKELRGLEHSEIFSVTGE